MIYFLTLFVILNEVKNLETFTLCLQILRYAQDDNWGLTDLFFSFINTHNSHHPWHEYIHKSWHQRRILPGH